MTNRTPSLLEPESRGGENAEKGFSFQENMLVAYLPEWLALEGFACLVRESTADTETMIFVPGFGYRREFLEVKNYRLTAVPFWEEIGRFLRVDQGSPNTFQWFRLVMPEVSDDLRPLLNGLRRVRSPYGFYEANSGVFLNSIADYRAIVRGLGQSVELADFLFTRVAIDIGVSMAQDHGFGLFLKNMQEFLPEYGDLPMNILKEIYANLKECISPSTQ